jgi:hypothetical protein
MDTVPTVRAIRAALEQIPGAIQDEPLTEDIPHGSHPGSPVLYLDPNGYEARADAGFLDQRSTGGITTEDFDAPLVVVEVPPSLTDGDVWNVLGDGPGELKRQAQVR